VASWYGAWDRDNFIFCVLLTTALLLLQEDYRLLESMNRATITKYSDMKQIASNVARTMIELNDKCK
jgi:hypothetical protein